MKYSLLLIFACLLSAGLLEELCAQNPITFYELDEAEMQKRLEGSTRHYVGLAIGVAFPEGSYRFDTGSAATAYARPGISVNFEGAYHVIKNVGIKAMVGYYGNGVNKGGLNAKLNTYLPNDVGFVFNNSVKWHNAYAAIGPHIVLAERKVLFELYLAGGLAYVSAPQINATGTYNETPLHYHRNADQNLSPAFAIGASVSYPLPGTFHYKLFAKAEYVGSNPELSIEEDINGSGFALNMNKTAKQHTGVFQISFGIRHEFGKPFQ